MSWTIIQSESFVKELVSVPKKVALRFIRSGYKNLRERPNKPFGNTIKKLVGYKNRYRYRVGDYRVPYALKKETNTVQLLGIDHRKDIYKRNGLGPDGELSPEVIAQIPEEELEREPTNEEVIAAAEHEANKILPDRDNLLPIELDTEILERIGIPHEYRSMLMDAETEGDLLECAPPVPEDLMDLLLNHIFPKNIEERVSEPQRTGSEEELEQILEGHRKLESLMLVLDKDQDAFLSRMSGVRPQGPWLVKGGPGSGKSLLALYAIQRLLEQQELRVSEPLQVLLTSYTNSLTSSSEVLLRELGLDLGDKAAQVTVSTCSRVVMNSKAPFSGFRFIWPEKALDPLKSVLNALEKEEPKSFELSPKFILQEIDWIILGHEIQDLDTYRDIPRIGRKKRLGVRQRTHIWKIWQQLKGKLNEKGMVLSGQRTLDALNHSAEPVYDYVFIDEAQDLKLAELRYLISICKKPSQVFVTADANQSIYGGGMPWKEVAADLHFRGKTRIFKKNHRNTKEVWEAIIPIATGDNDYDPETLGSEAYKPGPPPKLFPYSEAVPPARPFTNFGNPLVNMISEALSEMTSEARMPYEYAAVLVPTNWMAQDIASGLPPEMKAKAMASNAFDLKHRGVKVTTFHAAKGLQFPIVVVAGLKDGSFPRREDFDDEDEMERSRRQLFVACSRAKGLLSLVYPKDGPSRFLGSLDEDQWEIYGEEAYLPRQTPSSVESPPQETPSSVESSPQETPSYVAELRKKYPRAYTKWSEDEMRILREEFQNGAEISELAELLQRQEGGIRGRLIKMGLLES